MSISSLGAGLAKLTQATPQAVSQSPAPSRQIQQVKPHHRHDGGRTPPVASDPGSVRSASSTGTTLNRLV